MASTPPTTNQQPVHNQNSNQSPPVSQTTQLLFAIRNLLQVCQNTKPPSFPDEFWIDPNPFVPNHIIVSVLIPLWRQTPDLNEQSPHWSAFLRLQQALGAHITSCSNTLKMQLPAEWEQAEQLYHPDRHFNGPEEKIQRPRPEHCFPTVRLSANIAQGSGLKRVTTHPSDWIAFTCEGSFEGGSLLSHDYALQWREIPIRLFSFWQSSFGSEWP